MVLCFKCSAETKRDLDELLSHGSYTDYSEAIAAAVRNMVVLTAEVGQAGAVVVQGTGTSESGPLIEHQHATGVQKGPRAQVQREAGPTIPVLFRVPIGIQRPETLARMPSDVFYSGQEVPLDRWIFGQFSKLLPVKASCRALANMCAEQRKSLDLDKAAGTVAKEASALGEYLVSLDRSGSVARDEALALGFPMNGENTDKSRLRYANQFVGALSKQGALTGLMVDLKLLYLANDGKRKILLTQYGWDFALMPNPVLDKLGPAGAKFGHEEVSYLLRHIQTHVPSEDFAFRTVLTGIRTGSDTPDALDELCKKHIEPERAKDLSDAFVTTQRTGVISRLADLGLVGRQREGVRVSYVLTELGNEYIDRSAAA